MLINYLMHSPNRFFFMKASNRRELTHQTYKLKEIERVIKKVNMSQHLKLYFVYKVLLILEMLVVD